MMLSFRFYVESNIKERQILAIFDFTYNDELWKSYIDPVQLIDVKNHTRN